MKLKNMIYLAVFIIVTTVIDAVATEARRIRYIILMYKKGMEIDNISGLVKAFDEKCKEETKEFVKGYNFVKGVVKPRNPEDEYGREL